MADENYVMEITYGGGTFSFPIMPKYFPSLSFNWKRSGHEVAVIDTIPVHGWFSEADQDTVIGRWNTLRAIAHNGAFLAIIVRKQSGTIIGSMTSATIENLKADDFDGGFVNHLEFEFSIREERGVTFPNLVNVEHEDQEIKEVDQKGEVKNKFRRRVLATGVRGNTNSARQFVLALKPSLANMTSETIRTVNYDGDVEGIWEYDTGDTLNAGIKRWVEKVTYLPGIRTAQFYKTSGIPILIQGGFNESLLQVEGTIERFDRDFPPADGLTGFFDGAVSAATEVVFADRPRIGAPYVTEWDADDPSKPHVYAMDYSYTLAFGEANPKPAEPPRPRDDWNVG